MDLVVTDESGEDPQADGFVATDHRIVEKNLASACHADDAWKRPRHSAVGGETDGGVRGAKLGAGAADCDVGEADQAHSGAGSPSVDPGHHWSARSVERANEHVEDAGNLGHVLAAVRGCGERTDVAAGTEVCAFADQKDAPDVVSDCLERLRALNQSFVVEGGAVGGGGNGDAEYALVEGHFAQVIDGSHSTHITGVRQPYETRGHIDTAT